MQNGQGCANFPFSLLIAGEKKKEALIRCEAASQNGLLKDKNAFLKDSLFWVRKLTKLLAVDIQKTKMSAVAESYSKTSD